MKRGETKPWRVRYEWPNGVKGTRVFATFAEARAFQAEQSAVVSRLTGDRCKVSEPIHR